MTKALPPKATRWVKGGPSPNPGGTPKGLGDMRRKARALTDQCFEVLEEALKSPVRKERFEAARELLDRGWGKPAITVEPPASAGLTPAEQALLALVQPTGEQVVDMVQDDAPAKEPDEVIVEEDDPWA